MNKEQKRSLIKRIERKQEITSNVIPYILKRKHLINSCSLIEVKGYKFKVDERQYDFDDKKPKEKFSLEKGKLQGIVKGNRSCSYLHFIEV